ncbi:MAG: chromosome partition protein [Actinomycetota bacterium]
MFLKSLTLKGFKSFADTTVLEMEPGVTVVVGPNGSGKSNVVDAVAWVLGAQAPSAVRSQKMEDVIFSGTTKRSALGRAEVMLTLDNSAGLLPLDFSEVTVSRTLFRNGDSEYAINGVECRLLDVQELLSDAGVGRQQHVIISQGQIDAVLTARAEDRRAIIEEAAGVLKFRKRKEKAERRLEATEANLLRVQDLIREVRRQLRPLERQAEAARRHGEVTAELRALRMFLSGREVASLRARLTTLSTDKTRNSSAEAELRRRLASLDTEVLAAEAELSASGDSGLSDELMRVEGLRERARGISALVAERRRSMERDQGQMIADDVVAAIEADAARMRDELGDVERGLGIAESEHEALAVEETAFDRERNEHGLLQAIAATEAATSAAEVRGELRTLRNAVETAAGEAQRLERQADELARRSNEMATREQVLHADLAAAETLVGEGRSAVAEATSRRDIAEASVDDAHRAHGDAERSAARTAARVEHLEAAVALAKARAGAESLGGQPGIVGVFLDLVDIDAGWDAAVRAALGEAVSGVVVSDEGSARSAIDALRRGGRTASLLPVPSRSANAGLPAGADPVRSRVRATDARVSALLDDLLSGVAVVDGAESAARALASGALVAVTREGDRFSRAGWTLGAADDTGSAELLDAARRAADSAASALESTASALAAAQKELTEARAALVRAVDEAESRARRLELVSETLTAVVNDRRALAAEETLARESAEAVRGRLVDSTRRVTELETILPGLEEAEAAEVEAARVQSETRAAIDAKAAHLTMRRRDLEVRRAGLAERQQFLRARLDEAEQRLAADENARREAAERRRVVAASLAAVERIAAVVEGHRIAVEVRLAALQEARRRQSDEVRAVAARLDEARRARHETERELEVLREQVRRVDVEEAESRMRLEAAVETIRRDLEVEPEEAERAPMPEVPEGTTHADRMRALERDLRLMGPINPLALQEFEELQQRHQFLEDQLNDVRTSRRELSQVIAAIDTEIQTVFATAFEDVSRNFNELFQLLFPGGRGRLVLTNPGDMLNTGIEVEATPPGKNLKKLSLLSGGERSLTALAFLFSVFRSRPSPFYVMDEVEAALDDPNLHRFLGLVAEFRRDAQLIIVSHQKRTMEAADCLMGVSMQPGGSSKVIVERASTVIGN